MGFIFIKSYRHYYKHSRKEDENGFRRFVCTGDSPIPCYLGLSRWKMFISGQWGKLFRKLEDDFLSINSWYFIIKNKQMKNYSMDYKSNKFLFFLENILWKYKIFRIKK